MAGETVVRAEGVGKKYARRLKHAMWYGLRDLAFPPRGPAALRPGEFWALREVGFELKRGECLGVIGANGSGKSTLLKLLGGILAPDEGRIEIHGRTGALIEIGAGFHPLLTGRENVYVNGAILGMSKREIDAKFDAIVEFAGVGEFLDTPVKFYSSGMYVRLGFAVAAHTQPDVLLIDEVLAVGDAAFRSKCYEMLSERLRQTAVVVVSHSFPMISRLCSKLLVLDKGSEAFSGKPEAGIAAYMQRHSGPEGKILGTQEAKVAQFVFLDAERRETRVCRYGAPLCIEFDLDIDAGFREVDVSITFATLDLDLVAQCHSAYSGACIQNTGKTARVSVQIPALCLSPNEYFVNLIVFEAGSLRHLTWHFARYRLRVEGEFVAGAPVHWNADWRMDEREAR